MTDIMVKKRNNMNTLELIKDAVFFGGTIPNERLQECRNFFDNIIEKNIPTPSKKLERFINESELDFNDISSEEFREYTFPNSTKLLIEKPKLLHVSESGGHRLIDVYGKCYYIKPSESWYINWMVGENEPYFVK